MARPRFFLQNAGSGCPKCINTVQRSHGKTHNLTWFYSLFIVLQQHYKQRGNNHPSREDEESDDDFEVATISNKRQCQVKKCKCNKTSEQCHKCKLAVCGKCSNKTYKKMICSNCTVRKSIKNQNHVNDNRINLFIRKLLFQWLQERIMR